MKILVFGAGVLGSLYGTRLGQAGHDVSILARGKRLEEITRDGIVLENAHTGHREQFSIPVVDRLDQADYYDLVIVLVRKNQLPSVLPALTANKCARNILFMVNNASGYDELIRAIGRDRIVLGFAGAGGIRQDGVVRYTIVSGMLQPTTFGELDGTRTERIVKIMQMFRDAGFPVAFTHNMDAWQKTHVAWVGPIAHAVYLAGGDHIKLSRSPDAIRLMVDAIREGFLVLKRLGVPITPPKHRMWLVVPRPLLIWMLQWWIGTHHFKTVAAAHAMAAPDEMLQLADEFRLLADAATLQTPAIDLLRSHIPHSASVPIIL